MSDVEQQPAQPTYGARYHGLVAAPNLWRALGAIDAYAYTNSHGPVRWGYGVGVESYVLELLTRARDAVGVEASDESVVRRAIVLRGNDRAGEALAALGRGLEAIAARGLTVSAAVSGQMDHVVRQLRAAGGE